ncbi:thioredoxin family protein [Priestia megaterium]|uniref:thioredoxin family protein n=1 Tax=Priestia megaterium TaxID=1404 RepID=UPI0021556B4C|nr:thioredoxin family protein [Priestia megaterium]
MSKKMKRNTVLFSVLLLVILLLIIMITRYQSHTDLYSKQVSLGTINRNIEDNKSVYVYYYQTNCIHCKKVSPYLIPLGEKQKEKFIILDLEKYTEGWKKKNIMVTPTLIYYKDGKEVSRIEGEHTEKEYKKFFNNQN